MCACVFSTDPLSSFLHFSFLFICHLFFSVQNAVETGYGDDFAAAAASVSQSPQIIAVGLNCLAPQHIEVHIHLITEILEHKHSSRFIKRTGRFDP